MKICRKARKELNIADSGALSDLAFLLIIFFIVIAVFNVNKGFILGLPKKNSSKLLNVEDIIKVKLDAGNKLYYENNVIELDELENNVKERLSIRPNMTFLLKIHPDARYQDFVFVIDRIRGLEVENFSFSMLEEKL